MTTEVFDEKIIWLGGSQSLSELPDPVKQKLDSWMIQQAQFVIGDGKGADRLMQRFLAEKGYGKVWIHVSGDDVRCNEGGWEVVNCLTFDPPGSYEFDKAKDSVMAELAHEALLLWDGESFGTRDNIIDMRRRGKPVTVFLISGADCREEQIGDDVSDIRIDSLRRELKRYGKEENVGIAAAVTRCPRAEKELHLQKDEVFLLRRLLSDGQPDPEAVLYPPFLSFTDVLAVIRDEMIGQDSADRKPSYALEKWMAKGSFNLTFFRFRDELIEVTPPDEDYHMEQTARFDLEGDEVVSFRLIEERKKKGNA